MIEVSIMIMESGDSMRGVRESILCSIWWTSLFVVIRFVHPAARWDVAIFSTPKNIRP